MEVLIAILVLSVGAVGAWQVGELLRRRRSRDMEEREALRERLEWLAGEDHQHHEIC